MSHEDNLIQRITENRLPHYEPFGWHHWPAPGRLLRGTRSMKEAMVKAKDFTLERHLEHMKCPFLVMHGGHDVLTVSQARKVYDHGQRAST